MMRSGVQFSLAAPFLVLEPTPNLPKFPMAYIQLVLSQLCIGVNIISCKFLADKLSLYLILEIRFIIGSLILGAIFLSNLKNYSELNKLPKLSFIVKLCLFAQAACGGFLFNFFLAKGLAYSSATYAGAITSLVPLFVALFSVFFLKERPSKNLLIALFLSMFGMFLLFYNDLDSNISYYGLTFLLLSVFPEALFTVLGKYTSSILSPLTIALIANLVNVVLFLPGCMYLDINSEITNILLSYRILISLIIYGTSGALFFLLCIRASPKLKLQLLDYLRAYRLYLPYF